MLDEALGVGREPSWEGDLLSQNHFENIVSVTVHEWWSSNSELICQDPESVEIRCPSMSRIQDDFRRHILGSPTESIGTIPRLKFLTEAKVSEFDIAAVLQ